MTVLRAASVGEGSVDGRRAVSVTSTGPDGIVVEVQVSGPSACSAEVLRTRVTAAVQHAVTVFESGTPIEVATGDTWLSVQELS